MRWFWGISLLLILIVIDLPDSSCDCTCEVSLGHNLLRYYLVKSEMRSAIWSWTREKTNSLAKVVTATTKISATSAMSPNTSNNGFNLTTILTRKAANVSMDLVDYILNTGLRLINWTFETSGFSASFNLNTYIEASFSAPLIAFLKATAIYWNVEVGIFHPVPTQCFPSLKSRIDGNFSLCLPCGCIAGVGFNVEYLVDKTLSDEPWLAFDIGTYSVNSATRFPYIFVRSAVDVKKPNGDGKIISIRFYFRFYFQKFSNADVKVLSDIVQGFSSINITSSILAKYDVSKSGLMPYVGALKSYESIYSTSGNSSNGSIFSAIDAVKASLNTESLSIVDIYKLPVNLDDETLNVTYTEEFKTGLFPTSSSPSSFSVVSETSLEVSVAASNISPSSSTTLSLVSFATPLPDSTNPVPDISSKTPFDNLPTIPSLSVISGTQQDVLISNLEKNVTTSDASRSITEGNIPSVASVSVIKSDTGVTMKSPIAGQNESRTPFSGATSMENTFFNLNNTTTESLLFNSSLSTSFLSSVKGPSSNNTTPGSVILNTSFTTASTSNTTATADNNKLDNPSTYDPDPFFKSEVSVIKKIYNDEWLLRKTIGTMPPITINPLLLSITIPAFVSVMILVSCCLILLSFDCPTKKAQTYEKTVFAQP